MSEKADDRERPILIGQISSFSHSWREVYRKAAEAVGEKVGDGDMGLDHFLKWKAEHDRKTLESIRSEVASASTASPQHIERLFFLRQIDARDAEIERLRAQLEEKQS